jgi:hypothetical protein
MLTRQQAIRGAQNFVLIFLSIGVVALYSSLNRPIWTDEKQHFAWGGIEDPLEAMRQIVTPILEGNAQTWYASSWLYFIFDYWLLNVFGANSLALRAPSIVSALLLLLFAVLFIRRQAFGFYWQLVTVLAFLTQTFFMYFAGEARPYMPLAASVLGVALYYSLNLGDRVTWWGRAIGWGSALVGVLMHAYVIFYLLGICLLFLILAKRNQGFNWETKQTLNWLNPAILLSAVGIEVLTRVPSVLRGGSRFAGDPFEFTARENLVSSFFFSHFPNFPVSWYSIRIFVILLLASLLAMLIARPHWSDQLKPLLGPIGLIGVGLSVSAFVSALSFVNGYWILSRQWVASMALCLLGTIWFFATLTRIIQSKSRLVAGAVALISGLMLCLFAPNRVAEQVRLLNDYRVQKEQIASEWADKSPAQIAPLWNETDVPNINIAVGGPVWPVNACFFPVGRNCP